ncbi:MAG: 2-hydroxyacid dehydrogenase [Ruminococcaceae bacterium]|nr:2-hydroxyacid dehydrogenase [Oscillospiraceae bacterium]
MKILLYDAKPYDRESFDAHLPDYPGITLDYLDADLTPGTARLAQGYDAICAFVNADLGRDMLRRLHEVGVKTILLRCAGFNQLDAYAADEYDMTVLRVPGYSPEAVAEHAMALALAVNRKLHKAYIKVRENNFSLVGLTGMTFHGKTAGIIGTGKIGQAMCRICRGFGMKVLAYDKYPSEALAVEGVSYVPLDQLLSASDLISLHCPLTDETYHMINKDTIEKLKPGCILINTSRGALVDSTDLIAGIRSHRFFGVGLDVYEEENNNVFENREDDILESSITSRLLSFPNVVVTSHQGFLTHEALDAIARTTLDNAMSVVDHYPIEANLVKV